MNVSDRPCITRTALRARDPGEDHVSAGTYGSLSAIELTDEYKTINAGSPG
jgi:hypothetical protein